MYESCKSNSHFNTQEMLGFEMVSTALKTIYSNRKFHKAELGADIKTQLLQIVDKIWKNQAPADSTKGVETNQSDVKINGKINLWDTKFISSNSNSEIEKIEDYAESKAIRDDLDEINTELEFYNKFIEQVGAKDKTTSDKKSSSPKSNS